MAECRYREGAPGTRCSLSVLGTIMFGLATPTEAAAVGALGSMLLSIGYRAFTWPRLKEAVYLTDRILVMTPRPGRLEGIVEVDLPRPRTTEVMRDPRYTEHVYDIRRMLGVDH